MMGQCKVMVVLNELFVSDEMGLERSCLKALRNLEKEDEMSTTPLPNVTTRQPGSAVPFL